MTGMVNPWTRAFAVRLSHPRGRLLRIVLMKQSRLPRRTLLAATPFLAGCSATDIANSLTSSRDVAQIEAQSFGPLPRHRFDLYRPANLPPEAPLVVFVYGGGWRAGQRRQYAFVALPLARQGCLVAVPDYRLWPESRFPDFVEDTALAVGHLAALEPRRRLVLMGHSAGAFNAACVALDARWGSQQFVHGFIGLAGPYDFAAAEVGSPGIFSGLPRVQAAPQPLRAGQTPPLLLIHGEADTVVGPYHSNILAARAREAGVSVQHVVRPGMGHFGVITAFADPTRALGLADDTVREAVIRFVLNPGESAARLG